jgi:hypothetical protein
MRPCAFDELKQQIPLLDYLKAQDWRPARIEEETPQRRSSSVEFRRFRCQQSLSAATVDGIGKHRSLNIAGARLRISLIRSSKELSGSGRDARRTKARRSVPPIVSDCRIAA